MNANGRISLVMITTLCLVMAGLFLGATEVRADGDIGSTSNYYTSFPSSGGPYIIGATWDGTQLRVVFNEDIVAATVHSTDFSLYDDAGGLTVVDGPTAVAMLDIPDATDQRVVALTGWAVAPEEGDSISVTTLADLWGEAGQANQGIQGADGNWSTDHNRVPIITGPVLVAARMVTGWADDIGNETSIELEFDANIEEPDGVAFDDADWIGTGAFATIGTRDVNLGYATATNILTISDGGDGATDGEIRQLWPGVDVVEMAAGAIRWDTGDVLNTAAQSVMIDNIGAAGDEGGPVLLGAYLNHAGGGGAAAADVYLVFSDIVDPSTLAADPNTQYTEANWAFGAATQTAAFTNAFTNVAYIQDNTLNYDETYNNETVVVINGQEPQDYQGQDGPDVTAIPFKEGVGIIRASYDDKMTVDPQDDVLDLWFSEEFADISEFDTALKLSDELEFVPTADFLNGADLFTTGGGGANDSPLNVTFWNDNLLGYGRCTMTGFGGDPAISASTGPAVFGGERLPYNARIRIAGTAEMTGVGSGDANELAIIPVYEDKSEWAASTGTLSEVSSLTGKFWDAGAGTDADGDETDEAYLAWREIGAVDHVDHWLLMSTKAGSAAFDDQFIEDFKSYAVSVPNLTPGVVDGGIQRTSLNIRWGQRTTDDPAGADLMANGDQIWFMLVPVTYWGAVGDASSALVFGGHFVVGPVCPPIDFDSNDDDMIHVRRMEVEGGDARYFIYGDANAAPCGEFVYVYDAVGAVPNDEIGHIAINADGSFDEIELLPDVLTGITNDPTVAMYYLRALRGTQYSNTATPIRNDTVLPSLANLAAGKIQRPDRFKGAISGVTGQGVYTEGDHINILLQAVDNAVGISDLLTITGDFTEIDTRSEDAAANPMTAIPFTCLANDQIDNDGDWVDTDLDGVMDFPEPYFDENNNGVFDPGETFLDMIRPGDTEPNKLFDGPGGSGSDYDANLDSSDPDEHGWYELALSTVADHADSSDVTKGFEIVSAKTVPNGSGGFIEMLNVPVYITVFDGIMEHTTEYGIGSEAFLCELDENPPTISEITGLGTLPLANTAWNAATYNEIIDTDPVYNLGRYVNFEASVGSDLDVLFGITQIYTDRALSGTFVWEDLLLDPPGVNADATAPGVLDFDDDDDNNDAGANVDGNGVDDDEDGVIDNPEEGIDANDPEVVDASQADLAADTAATNGDGIHRGNDLRDNDNDAFFIIDPYYSAGLNGLAILQRVTWYNIDEGVNLIDDDNDGFVDETTDNTPETEPYTPVSDDNEDGIYDGEAVLVDMNGGTVRAIWDVTSAADIYVDRAHLPGSTPADFDNDICPTAEFVPYGHAVLSDGLAPQAMPHLLYGQATTQADMDLSWIDSHGTNIDFDYFSKLYGMTTDGAAEYMMRVVAYDDAGLANADNSVPVTFTLDITPPTGELTGCEDGLAPADFVDVDPDRGGVQVFDGLTYGLTVTGYEDAVSVSFYGRTSSDDGATWTPLVTTTDTSEPYTGSYTAPVLDNAPPADSLLVEFWSLGTDAFGNLQSATEACTTSVTVIDGMAPTAWFTSIHTTANLSAATPPIYYYRDTYGIVQVPAGPAIDIDGDFDDNDGIGGTNDVTQLVFEYRAAGAAPDVPWIPFETITGAVVDDGGMITVDMTRPVKVTLDTETMGTGMFDIRIYGCDIEGNCNRMTADIATIAIVEEGLRAYAENPFNDGAVNTLDLYALTYIHDAEIDFVEFQWYFDADGDHIDNDAGESWKRVAVDGAATGRGDILLRRGTATLASIIAAPLHTAFAANEYYYDWDGDGYSERDPIIQSADALYDGGDVVLIGSADGILASGNVALTAFPATHFHTGAAAPTAASWIFQDNGLQAAGGLQFWMIDNWDVTGQPAGNYLVRGVATDEFGAIDDAITSPSVIPFGEVLIDPTPPIATITGITLPDGTALDPVANPNMSVSGTHKWFKLTAECDAEDLDYMTFQFMIPGHATYGTWGNPQNQIDINNDNDFFADVNGVMGWQANGTTMYDDEVVLDNNGDFVYDEDDTVLFAGANGVVNVQVGDPLMPLVTEDIAGAVLPADDEDGDGRAGEDPMLAKDYDAPFEVYFIVPVTFVSTVDVNFRVVAYDVTGNSDMAQATMDAVVVMLGESTPPETDVITVTNLDGAELDVFPTVADGDGFDQIGTTALDMTLRVFATAEDGGIGGLGAVSDIDLMWRYSTDCYTDLEPWENSWQSMEADGYATQIDDTIFEWDVDVAAILAAFDGADGVIEFFPQGTDHAGNMTVPPVNPYGINLFANYAMIATGNIPEGTMVSEGDEYLFEATLAYPDSDAMVKFWYATRALAEEIDASLVSPSFPYTSPPLDPAIGPRPMYHAVLTIDGAPCTYYEDLTLAPAVATNWTMNGNLVEFAAPPAVDAVILIDYNTSGYTQIGETDSNAPYTAAWHSGAAVPASTADAFDIIATAHVGTGNCAMEEIAARETSTMLIIGEMAPTPLVYMGGLGNKMPNATYWPGNPSFVTVGLVPPSATEWKLSGIESEIFVVKDPLGAGGMIPDDGVQVFITDGTDNNEVTMAYHGLTAETVAMDFTMYESDFTNQALLYPVENVALKIGTMLYPMAETATGSGIWQVMDVPLPVGATTTYTFEIDMVGDNFGSKNDMRNVLGTSTVNVPPVPFWYGSVDMPTTLGEVTGVWSVYATMTDEDSNAGSSVPVKFIYDPVAPTVDAVSATLLRFAETQATTVFVDAFDPTPATFDVITVAETVFEYCPNYAAAEADRVWLGLGNDTTAGDSWLKLVAAGTIVDPENDDYDNNADGEWDEVGEGTSQMAFRVWARDDAYNFSAPVVLPFTLDSTDPEATITYPGDGMVFPWSGGDVIVAADITESQDDIMYVQFEVKTNAGWVVLDCTPEDASDPVWDTTAPYECPFYAPDYLAVGDAYARFRARARDTAGNFDGDPMEVLVIFNDITGPTAYPATISTTGGPPMPFTDVNTAVDGPAVLIAGTAADPTNVTNIAKVVVEYQAQGADAWTVIDIDNTLTGPTGIWSVIFNTDGVAEGPYDFKATAFDFDGNFDENPLIVSARVDHTVPSVMYVAMGDFAGFAPFTTYMDDGATGSSNVFTPDPETGDLTMAIITPDNDVKTVALQYREDGVDALGVWNAWPGTAALDFEPNLTFEHESVMYYVWRLKIDNFVTTCAAAIGTKEVRALATDYAGNANILYNNDNPWEVWTIDTGLPAGVRILDDLEAHQVVSGGVVNLDFEGTDATTDIASVRFEVRLGTGPWTVVDPDPDTDEIEMVTVTGENIDTEFCRWRANVDYVTPHPIVMDTPVDVRTIFYDSAGNMQTYTHSDLFTVEDRTAPAFTKIVALPAAARYVDTAAGSGAYTAICEGAGEHDGLFWDLNGNTFFDAGTDLVIDYGAGVFTGPSTVHPAHPAAGNTFPPFVTENEISGGADIVVANSVFVVARGQVGDTGIERVEFFAVDGEGTKIPIGIDECIANYGAFGTAGAKWHIIWDTEEINAYGQTITPDGTYTIVAQATDLEGNVEDWDVTGGAVVTVDNTASMAEVTGRYPETGEFVASIDDVERNDWFTLLATVDGDRGDDSVGFYFKLATDLNLPASWIPVNNTWGLDVTDINPDQTRPYDFDWDLNKMTTPLVCGETYHVAVGVTDVVGNTGSHFDAFDAGYYFTFMVVDNKAPIATITRVKRHTGNTDDIVFPNLYADGIYARDFSLLEATILDGDHDVVDVEFHFAPAGQTEATLIDIDADQIGDHTWSISNWDLRTLAEGTYDVWAVAFDDCAGSDSDASRAEKFQVVVDHTAPVVDLGTTPADLMECPAPGLSFASAPGYLAYGQSDGEIATENYGPVGPSATAWVQPYGFYEGTRASWSLTIVTTGTFSWLPSGATIPVVEAIGENVYLEDGVWVDFLAGSAGLVYTPGDVFTFSSDGLIYDLTFTSDDMDIDTDEVYWEYKKSSMPDLDGNWTFRTVSAGNKVLFDLETRTYSTSMDVSTWDPGVYDVRLTVFDLSGNKVMIPVAQNIVVDNADPMVAITNVIINGEDDTVIDPVDFGTVIDVSQDDVITLWATASDDESGLPADVETGVSFVRFQSRFVGGAWRNIGEWVAPTEAAVQVSAMIDWNVSGLQSGAHEIRAIAIDELCNDSGASNVVTINVRDYRPPRARIAAFDPWTETHGDDPKTYCDIYAIAYSDDHITEVRFDYDANNDGNWVTVGTASDYESDCNSEEATGDIWYTTIELTAFEVGDMFGLKAIATDEVPNTDPTPPTIMVEVVEMADGSLDLMPYYETAPVEVTKPEMVMVGGSSPDDLVVTVTMDDPTQKPHIMWVNPLPAGQGGGVCWVSPVRHIDNDAMWSGTVSLDEYDCGKTQIFASGLTDDGVVDLKSAMISSYEVTNALGTNGMVSVLGYSPSYSAYASIMSGVGSGFSGYCFMLCPTPAPGLSVDQERYLSVVDKSSYFMGMIGTSAGSINVGYEPMMKIEYSEDAMIEAFGGDVDVALANEQYLTVRVFDDSCYECEAGWSGDDISHVNVFTEENYITFKAKSFTGSRPVYAVFAPQTKAPVVVSSFKPSGVRYGAWTTTSVDPTIVAYLHAGGIETIDLSTVEVWIDGLLWAANLSGGAGAWVRGNGRLEVNMANTDGTIAEVIYRHSFLQENWLTDGEHTLNIMYKSLNGLDEWISLPATAPGAVFYADNTAPQIEFHGGWVDNPLLSNVSGYLNPEIAEDMLTVRLYDENAGIYMRRGHNEWVWDADCTDSYDPGPSDAMWPGANIGVIQGGSTEPTDGCWVEVDYGFKYDLWLVHDHDMMGDEDDQSGIDEIEERLLLHQGTADEVLPYCSPPMYGDGAYTPDSVLTVGLPIMGGTGISDGDVIEVTLYSHKKIISRYDGVGEATIEEISIDDDNVISIYSGGWNYDGNSESMHVYTDGIIDCAWNQGSKYVEQRFVVDMAAPAVSLVTPTEGYTAPGEDFEFVVALDDSGAEIDPESIHAYIYGPGGEKVPVDGVTYADGKLSGTVVGLPVGNYTLEVEAADQAGNVAVVQIPIYSQNQILTLSETYMYPNPVNPGDVNGLIHFNLGKDADVTINVYDFAGDYVATLANMRPFGFGPQTVPWGGQASDGTELANGAYMVRIDASDGSVTKSATVKAVIWRE